MIEPLISTQVIVQVMPSSMSILTSILSTIAETTINKFDLSIDQLSSFVEIAEKDDTDNYDKTTISHHANENNDSAHHVEKINLF